MEKCSFSPWNQTDEKCSDNYDVLDEMSEYIKPTCELYTAKIFVIQQGEIKQPKKTNPKAIITKDILLLSFPNKLSKIVYSKMWSVNREMLVAIFV